MLLHLRLPFQFLLTPFLLAGAFVSTSPPSWFWLVPFLVVHVALYGGATAYNSYYDRDRGPIAFMKRPVPVPRRVRDLSLMLMAVSVPILVTFHPAAGAIALVMALMGIAYSNPRWRWKSRAIRGLVAVGTGQGAGAVYLGYYAMGGSGMPTLSAHTTALGASFVAMGLYPLTQVYQIEEDRRRGDRTVPVRWGWRFCFVFSALVSSMGLWTLARALAPMLSGVASIVLPLAPGALALALIAWAKAFERNAPERNHDWAMAIALSATLLFWGLLVMGLAARGASR